MDRVKIDTSKIPNIELEILSRTIIAAAQRFYEDPENKKRFEKWKAERTRNNDAGSAR